MQPAADSAPLQGAEAAALRRQLASLQQQLAVERQLSRAATREKADIDASLADLTRQVGLLLQSELQRCQEVRMHSNAPPGPAASTWECWDTQRFQLRRRCLLCKFSMNQKADTG